MPGRHVAPGNAFCRGEFLDAAQRLIQTKRYEQMSIQDVLAEAGTSKGGFTTTSTPSRRSWRR
ncbi:TetR family transcriptional regulator [Acrocarpospora corrugata]|uniref:TetR family transcriptional regulator n=1 Tax=Acrocarpospora corrugata TaxID=35763 RepID=UPI0014789015|nr:TetR family transcriptional regulator [Acrocarpospora corrugata]